jgi:hypothetical protein
VGVAVPVPLSERVAAPVGDAVCVPLALGVPVGLRVVVAVRGTQEAYRITEINKPFGGGLFTGVYN